MEILFTEFPNCFPRILKKMSPPLLIITCLHCNARFENHDFNDESGGLKGHLQEALGEGNTGIRDVEGVQDRKERHPLVDAMKN